VFHRFEEVYKGESYCNQQPYFHSGTPDPTYGGRQRRLVFFDQLAITLPHITHLSVLEANLEDLPYLILHLPHLTRVTLVGEASHAIAKRPQQVFQRPVTAFPPVHPHLTQVDLSYVPFSHTAAREFMHGLLNMCPHLICVRVAREGSDGIGWSKEDDQWLRNEVPGRLIYPSFEQPEEVD